MSAPPASEAGAPPAAGTAELLDSAREMLRTEADAVAALADRLDGGFAACCRMLAGYAGLALLLACYLGWMGGTAAAPG